MMKNNLKNKKTAKKSTRGITLIALVVTIIVLLILAGISIQMLTGDNGILNRAVQAKEATRGGEVQERVRLEVAYNTSSDYLGGAKKYKEQVVSELHTEKKLTDEEVEELEENDVITIGGITIDFSVLGSAGSKTLGEEYKDNWIGKTINYTSANNSSEIEEAGGWIILGKDKNGDILITTANPVSSQPISYTLAEWTGYEKKINNACKNYAGQTGSLGSKATKVNDVRSITLNDINTAVGFNQTINTVTLGGTSNEFAYPKDDGSGWVVKGEQGSNYSEWAQHPIEAYYYYNNNGYKFGSATNGFSDTSIVLDNADNMAYILANNSPYWVASRSVLVRSVIVDSGRVGLGVARVGFGDVCSNSGDDLCNSDAGGGRDFGGSTSMAFRPVVVLSSEIPYADATIGDYYEYTGGGSGSEEAV
ncbi:MAG: hypothetical protein ILA02_01455 [Clostridia bacterium]|nr:hypothetical protein [Clostridia bacterium]